MNFQMIKLVLEKAEETEIKLPTSSGSWKKQESFRKPSISAFFFFLNKKFYWRKIEPPRTQGKEHKNSTDTELKVTTTQCCLRLLFHFLNGFPQFLK